MDCTGATDIGRRRSENQDNFYITISPKDELALSVVCDGMGGAKSGNIASDMTISIFSAEVKKRFLPQMSASYMKAIFNEAIRTANTYTYKKSLSDAKFEGMGSTIVALAVAGEEAVAMNVGDSRIYCISDGAISQITVDHSVAQEMVRRGEITPEEAKKHPSRNYITRAVGTERTIVPQFYELKIKQGDRLLLCSDGLTNMVEDQVILEEITKAQDSDTAVKNLISLANQNGGTDNVTVVLFSM